MTDSCIRVGVDVGGTKLEAVAMDASGAILVRQRVATPKDDYAGTVAAISQLVRSVENQAGGGLARVGLGTPGALSRRTGRMKNCNSTCLNGMPFKQDLEASLGREVRMANDADCLALSEAVDGAGAGCACVFAAILGTGVGGGVVVRGQLLAGPNGIAGEWGHNPLPWMQPDETPGPACYCGKRGCIETFLSGPGFSASYQRLSGLPLAAPDIITRMRAGESHALVCWNAYVERLGRSLATILNVLDPHVVVLGGGMSNVPELYAALPEVMARHVFSDVVETLVKPAQHGDSSGVRGAAWLWGAHEM